MKNRLNAKIIKNIAIIAMLIDHIGIVFITGPLYIIFRNIGRVAFPIFSFFIVEGFNHVKDDSTKLKKYILRLSIFSIISEIPYDLATNNKILEFSNQNVYFTLLLGLLNLCTIHYIISKNNFNYAIKMSIIYISTIIYVCISMLLHTDYCVAGIIAIMLMYILPKYVNVIIGVFILTVYQLNIFVLCSLPFLFLYNGERGKQNKWLFYWFYPIHLLILGLIKL